MLYHSLRRMIHNTIQMVVDFKLDLYQGLIKTNNHGNKKNFKF